MFSFHCLWYFHNNAKVDWSKFIAVNGATAHPHVDPDGTAYNMGNSYSRKGEIITHIHTEEQKTLICLGCPWYGLLSWEAGLLFTFRLPSH